MFQNAESRYFFLFNKVIKNLVKTWVTSKDCVIKKRANIFMLRSREGKNYILHAHELRQCEKAVKVQQKISEL